MCGSVGYITGNSFTVRLVFKLMLSFDNVSTCIRPKLLICCLAIIIVDVSIEFT